MNTALTKASRRLRNVRRNYHVSRSLARHQRPPDPELFGAFGAGSVVVPPARVSNPGRIFVGDSVSILEHCWLSVIPAVDGIEPRLSIGDGTRMTRFIQIACVGSVTIGREALIGDQTFIGDSYHMYQEAGTPVIHQPMSAPEPVVIGDGVFIGVASIILMGVTIGDGAYVGAGSVVTRDVPPLTVVAGNPARPVKQWNQAKQDWASV